MFVKGLTSFLAGGLLVVAGVSLHAQSLGDVAKKEEERRKATTPAAKVYTNKDLPGVPAPASQDTTALKEGEKAADADKDSDKAADKTPDKPAGSKDGADKPAADKAASGATKDQKYWRERIEAARTALERDSGYLDAMQTRVNALTTDFVNRDDPAKRAVIERDRQRALAELERLRTQIADDRKAISDIEEEARRSGVPPGWLR